MNIRLETWAGGDDGWVLHTAWTKQMLGWP